MYASLRSMTTKKPSNDLSSVLQQIYAKYFTTHDNITIYIYYRYNDCKFCGEYIPTRLSVGMHEVNQLCITCFMDQLQAVIDSRPLLYKIYLLVKEIIGVDIAGVITRLIHYTPKIYTCYLYL
jgi:hypothetical protein